MDTLDKEYQYFKDNRQELLKKHKNKFLVIQNEKIVGSYNTELEAYQESVKKFELGTFLLQQCVEEKSEEKAIFHTRVIFS